MVDYKDKYNQEYKSFIEVIESEIEYIMGISNDIEIDASDERIHINCNNCRVGTIMVMGNKFYLSSPFDENDTYGFESLDFFRDYIKQFISNVVSPKVMELYSNSYLETLPSKMSYDFKFDINKLKGDWLIDKFNELAPNSETAENVNFVFEGNGNVRIKFDIDCGRYGYWRGQIVRINERGNVCVDISDCPLEGNGLDDELMNAIIEQIKI